MNTNDVLMELLMLNGYIETLQMSSKSVSN